MLLQGEPAAGVGIILIHEIDGLLIVHENLNVVAFDDDVLGPPGVVLDQLLIDRHKVVEAAGPDRIGVGIIDLRFVAWRESRDLNAARTYMPEFPP